MGTGSSEDTGEREDSTSRPAGTTILISAAIGLVVAIAVAAVVAATRDAPVLDEGSPEAVVQAYVDAMIEGDESAAHGYLSVEIQAECSVSDLRDRAERPQDLRVTLRSVTVDGDEAEVEVTVTENAGGGLFGGDGYSYDETFILTGSGEAWVISERPWPVYFCTN